MTRFGRCSGETVSLPGSSWRMPIKNFGAFMLQIRFPLGISRIKLKNGKQSMGSAAIMRVGNCKESPTGWMA